MLAKLKMAVARLDALDGMALPPVERGNLREAALVDGLHALAEEFGRNLDYTRIDSNGEMPFCLGALGPGTYGEELAAVLSLVPRRTGVVAYEGPVLPESNWCRINHFDAERLLRLAVERLDWAVEFGGENQTQPSAPR